MSAAESSLLQLTHHETLVLGDSVRAANTSLAVRLGLVGVDLPGCRLVVLAGSHDVMTG
jgi:hypothetical protein